SCSPILKNEIWSRSFSTSLSAASFVGTSNATMILSATLVIPAATLSCRARSPATAGYFFRRPIRDSSTSLGMTEQIAGNYASPRSCEDQSFAENSRRAERWFPRTRYAHHADFDLRTDQNP